MTIGNIEITGSDVQIFLSGAICGFWLLVWWLHEPEYRYVRPGYEVQEPLAKREPSKQVANGEQE